MNPLEKLQKDFVDLRFGTFIHFNSATVQFHSGETVDWEYDCENGPQPRKYPFSPAGWNPDKLDCGQWAAIAKSAGCRFAALTAKHHEGFALWPTACSEHCVKNAACSADVVAEYLSAFRAVGIAAGLYFSILDLTAGIGRRSCTPQQKALIKGEITELLTNYGEIPFLITDGWGAPWGGPGYEALPFEELDSLVKGLQPRCLLLNIGCSGSLRGTDIPFFENAAGQGADAFFAGPGVACNKLTGSWFWRAEDARTPPAGAQWVQEKLAEYFPANCAFMLNLSPDIHGQVEPNLAKVFGEIGESLHLPAPLRELPQGWMRRS